MGGQQQGPEVQSPSLTAPVLWWLCPSRPWRPALGAWGSQPSWCLPPPGTCFQTLALSCSYAGSEG